jgi:hypothetical protein
MTVSTMPAALRVADAFGCPGPVKCGVSPDRFQVRAQRVDHRVMRVVIVAAITVAGCGSDSPSCFLEDVVADWIGEPELEDCGTVASTTPIAAANE